MPGYDKSYFCVLMTEQTIKVSIVEDIKEIREALRVLINGSAGFECIHVFPDAEEALEKIYLKHFGSKGGKTWK